MVVTGDTEQCDLDDTHMNGLTDLVLRMSDDVYNHIDHVELEVDDIQRSEAVREVLEIYTNY